MTVETTTAGTPLFAFAVVADTHVNPEDGQSSSPWRTNRLAEGLRAPLHLVSGNHDVGDKPTPWSPAAPVNARFLAIYREHFGKDVYAFEHRGCRFVVINSQVLNSGLIDEHDQWMWLERQLATEQRVFLFKHYPPFLHDADEEEHYDNLAEPARSRLLDLLQRCPVEALFCGHVHNFFYNRIGATDCYVVPAVSAVRHDYMELFPVPPIGNEHGRDARGKLGFFWIEVFANNHIAHWVRTWGATDAEPAAGNLARPRIHVRTPTHAPVGVDLRHGWLDSISIPHTGAVDEFGRKNVRNDYYLAALWEMGIRRLRIPLQDLLLPASSERRHRFTVFTFGLPDTEQRNALAGHAASLDAVEIIECESMLSTIAAQTKVLKSELGIPVFLSKLQVADESKQDKGHFAHVIRHGFRPGEPAAAALIENAGDAGLDGLVYRLDREEAPWPALHAIAASAETADLRAIVHVRLAGNNPAQEMADDADSARRVADAVLAAWCLGDRVSVFFDTLADHDRGYFPRHGLIDRSCNPRPAGLVLKHLVEMLASVDLRFIDASGDGMVRIIRASDRQILLLLPDGKSDGSFIDLQGFSDVSAGDYVAVRLDTGLRVGAAVRSRRNGLTIKWDGALPDMPVAISRWHEPADTGGKEMARRAG